MNTRGFSLIEILMVIAIIGVLATIVVVSVTSARNRGIDTSIQENLHTVRNQAELRHSNVGTYGSAVAVQASAITTAPVYNATGANFLISDLPGNNALRAAIDEGDAAFYAIGVNGQSWAVAVGLKSVTGYWCVDANGTGKVITSGALGGGSAVALCP